MCVCVCVCVREREREQFFTRWRGREECHWVAGLFLPAMVDDRADAELMMAAIRGHPERLD